MKMDIFYTVHAWVSFDIYILRLCVRLTSKSFTGRFGNQADHFLGALGFAHGLNRTLVIPPWVEYRYGEPRSIQVPFDTYFQIEPLQAYHRVITMERFMQELAPEIWPAGQRSAFCYISRGSGAGCNPKEGNPFGPFWDTFGVDFSGSINAYCARKCLGPILLLL